MMRLALISGFIAGVNGLQTNDAPLALQGSRVMTGSVSALDPDLTDCFGERFHVTQQGEYVMIGLPESCNPETPDACELIFSANFDKLEHDSVCNDLMIRNVTVQGSSLGNMGTGSPSGVNKIDFSIYGDLLNDSAALGLQVNDGPYLSMTEFVSSVPACTMAEERGYFRFPTKHTYRFRTITHNVECDFELGDHKFKLQFGVVWRGNNVDTGEPTYANDISFLSIGNVGKTAIGILCTDDHSAMSEEIPECNKKQPVNGPYQVRHGPKFPKRHHWR